MSKHATTQKPGKDAGRKVPKHARLTAKPSTKHQTSKVAAAPGGMDLAAFDALTEGEVIAGAKADPDAQPSTPDQLAKMRRVSPAKRIRQALGLSQEEFAERFRIPIGTLRDWEQRRRDPGQAAAAYLDVIEKIPAAVLEALKAA